MSRSLNLIIALVAAAAALFLLWDRPGPARVVEPARTAIDQAAWRAYVKRVTAATTPAGPEVVAVTEAMAAVNAIVARLGTDALVDDGYRRAGKTFRDEARRWIELRGPEGYVGLGRKIGLTLLARIPPVLEEAEMSGAPLETFLARAEPSPAVAAYIEVGGGFLRSAGREGFVRHGALVDAMAPLLQGLFMDHWLAPLRDVAAVDGQLRPEERRWLYQWRAEYQRQGSPKRKLAAIDALARGGDYPAHLNAGVVLFRAGRHAEAVDRFSRSGHPHAPAFADAARAAVEMKP
jgi:hypothetical protein